MTPERTEAVEEVRQTGHAFTYLADRYQECSWCGEPKHLHNTVGHDTLHSAMDQVGLLERAVGAAHVAETRAQAAEAQVAAWREALEKAARQNHSQHPGGPDFRQCDLPSCIEFRSLLQPQDTEGGE